MRYELGKSSRWKKLHGHRLEGEKASPERNSVGLHQRLAREEA